MAVRRFHEVVEDHDLLDHDRQEVVIVLEEVELEIDNTEQEVELVVLEYLIH